MNQLIASYYLGERSTAIMGVAAGLLILAMTFVLWRTAPSGTLARGAAYALLVFGLLYTTASGGYLATLRVPASQSANDAQVDRELQQREVKRMEGVLTGTAYTGTLAFLTAMIGAGLALALLSRERPLLVGIGLALMATGVMGHVFEAISMQKNRAHLQAVKDFTPAFSPSN